MYKRRDSEVRGRGEEEKQMKPRGMCNFPGSGGLDEK